MKEFFTVSPLENVFEHIPRFPVAGAETKSILESTGRIIAEDILADIDIPGFDRSTMDGYAVCASSTFGATEANPAYLAIKGSVAMGETPPEAIKPGEALRISTGGMMPAGADSVIMLEHTSELDKSTLEVFRSVPPGSHVITKGEDIPKGQTVIFAGTKIRPQEAGLLAALGHDRVKVHKKPVIGILSTGDEIVPIHDHPGPAQVRDINTYTLTGMILAAGGTPAPYGLVKDEYAPLRERCRQALDHCDMVIISGGSSMGARDLTIEVIAGLPDSCILIHGVSISPGKPTILADVGKKPFWGLPGHVTSAMIVFDRLVRPFIERAAGMKIPPILKQFRIAAKLARNVASAQGRVDFIRVRLIPDGNEILAEPILGKSGLLSTMVQADGLIEIDINTEGLDKGAAVSVIPF
jgi:molybdopterin molybdotransferase